MLQKGIMVVDFGGQYNQLIARRVREAGVYCEIVHYNKLMGEMEKAKAGAGTISGAGGAGSAEAGAGNGCNIEAGGSDNDHHAKADSTNNAEAGAAEADTAMPLGIIFTGGPNSVYLDDAPRLPKELFEMGIPILGICYGAQLMAHVLGGKVVSPEYKEYGRVRITAGSRQAPAADYNSLLFAGIESETLCWMSHTDYIEQVPEGFRVSSHTENCPTASMENAEKKLYAVQFHPEVHHTPFGQQLLTNFLYKVCQCERNWDMSDFAWKKVEEIRQLVGDRKVLCALSGGVDSSVAAVMVHKAIGDNLTCIFVDHGLLRKDEGDQVMEVYGRQFNMKIKRVNAQERFLSKLAGVSDPETKRKIIGNEFIAVFDEESTKLYEEEGGIDFLLQGTIYPDVVESGAGEAAVIKSHHNVGGLPENMKMELLEPLRLLFKDEVRAVGEELGIAHELVWRQPFPGPGLAIRCLGDVTDEKLEIIRESDAILREEIAKNGLQESVWQYFTVLPNIRSVGVMGDFRTYDHTVGIRAVTSVDGMTSDWARIPYEVLEVISNRIVNEVKGVNRIVYDITSKPPSTIEWE